MMRADLSTLAKPHLKNGAFTKLSLDMGKKILVNLSEPPPSRYACFIEVLGGDWLINSVTGGCLDQA